MAKDTEPFLARWSRLKHSGGEAGEAPQPAPAPVARRQPAEQAGEAPLPELPPIDQLTPESDFRPFMDPRVPDAMRRLALRKLYADPHFNVPDMLDDFAEDYTLLEALPAGMAGKIAHARRTLLGQEETDRLEAEEREEAAKSAREGALPPPDTAAEPSRVAERGDEPAERAPASPSGEPGRRDG